MTNGKRAWRVLPDGGRIVKFGPGRWDLFDPTGALAETFNTKEEALAAWQSIQIPEWVQF